MPSSRNRVTPLAPTNPLIQPNFCPNMKNINLNLPPINRIPYLCANPTQMIKRGKWLKEPPIQPPLRNNANCINECNDDATSQLINLEEEGYTNGNYINSFDVYAQDPTDYIEKSFWDRQLQHYKDNLRPTKIIFLINKNLPNPFHLIRNPSCVILILTLYINLIYKMN